MNLVLPMKHLESSAPSSPVWIEDNQDPMEKWETCMSFVVKINRFPWILSIPGPLTSQLKGPLTSHSVMGHFPDAYTYALCLCLHV